MRSYSDTLGNRIRYLRSEATLSQEQLALKAGIAPSFLGEIERGIKKPSIDTIEKIAIALEISLSELFNYESKTRKVQTTFILTKSLKN